MVDDFLQGMSCLKREKKYLKKKIQTDNCLFLQLFNSVYKHFNQQTILSERFRIVICQQLNINLLL